MSFDNEEKLKLLMERNRQKRDEYFRANLDQQINAAAAMTSD